MELYKLIRSTIDSSDSNIPRFYKKCKYCYYIMDSGLLNYYNVPIDVIGIVADSEIKVILDKLSLKMVSNS